MGYLDWTMVPTRVRRRFWSHVAATGDDECWWFGLSVGSHGYGQIGWSDNGRAAMLLAHRVAYVLWRGPIPDALTVDHLCRNRQCVNPAHLRLLSNRENAAWRAHVTHCKRGHEFTPENTRRTKLGHRACRSCARLRAGRTP